ncbi:MAG: HEAT repeat domain-containing protein [Alphaproteobacteria bacterium]|nr:HEAT repeat domain-containing protein [Alphaproteobacteria bacterium]
MAESTGTIDRLINDAIAFLHVGDANDPRSETVVELGKKAFAEFDRRTDATTLEAVIKLSKSADNTRKRLGAAVLGNLGRRSPDHPGGVFGEERYHALRDMLDTEIAAGADPDILGQVCSAFSNLQDRRAVALVLPFIAHSNAELRSDVALALAGHDDEAAIEGLIRLSADPDDGVRALATLGFQQIDADSAAIRAALHARLTDCSDDIRDDAITALAQRNDRTVLPFLSQALTGPEPHLLLDLARKLEDPSLCPALEQAWNTISGHTADKPARDHWRKRWLAAMAACGCPVKDR